MGVLRRIRDYIIAILDWFYPPFRRFMPKQMFRYAATGGANTVLDIVLYAVVYAFILNDRDLHLWFITMSPHIAAFFIVFPVTFIVGFCLAKYVTFTNSNLHGKHQLVRYFTTVMGSILLNYVLLKLLVDIMHINAIIANIINKVIVIAYSYFAQTYFSFRTGEGKRYK